MSYSTSREGDIGTLALTLEHGAKGPFEHQALVLC